MEKTHPGLTLPPPNDRQQPYMFERQACDAQTHTNHTHAAPGAHCAEGGLWWTLLIQTDRRAFMNMEEIMLEPFSMT